MERIGLKYQIDHKQPSKDEPSGVMLEKWLFLTNSTARAQTNHSNWL